MNISVLGGGNEIGASCLHIEINNTSIIIDAGMRMQGDNVLPMLGMLDNLNKPEAILVTHAHADHIGALPIVHNLYPEAPVYATPPTADLMQIMMKDSFKILTEQTRISETLMPYTEEQMSVLLDNLRVFPANGILEIGNLKITVYQAGHILGAVMFMIESEGESLLITGDLSFRSGRTIPGAKVAKNLQPNVVVMESTYGNRMHTDRHTEEKRLAENVADTIENGGFALVPAFALGRAQEVMLVLQDFMEKGLIPSFPIYVDGLVTPVSRIYKSYPHYLKGPVAHRIRTNGDAFLTEGRCMAVSAKDRKEIINGKPACIIASSGMLTGGASAWYAKHIVSDKKNAIFLTGYQDEESPGKKLLALAEGTETTLDIDGETHQVHARVDKFGLSAHADASEMTRFIEALEPAYTLLVHGDDEARTTLADKIHPKYHPTLVENGETYPFKKRKSGQGVVGKNYRINREQERLRQLIGNVLLYKKEGEETLRIGLCQNVHPKTAILFMDKPKGKIDRIEAAQVVENIGKWNLPIEEFQEAAENVFSYSRPYLEKINWDLAPEYTASLQEFFQKLKVKNAKQQFAVALALQSIPDKHRFIDPEGTNGYKLTSELRRKLSNLDMPVQAIKMNANHAMDMVREFLKDHPRFLKCGVQEMGTEAEHILLSFDFPKGITDQERKDIENQIMHDTGWPVVFSDSVRHEAFQPLLSQLLEQPADMPSVHINEGLVVTKDAKPENAHRVMESFAKITGFTLQFAEDGAAPTVETGQAGRVFRPAERRERMENNQAIQTAKQYGKEFGVTIYKASIKMQGSEPFMELHFISPEVADNFGEMMQALSDQTGMNVQPAKQPKQNEIIRITKESIPSAWNLKGNPSIHMDKAKVSIKIPVEPSSEDWETVAGTIKKQTGYQLQLK